MNPVLQRGSAVAVVAPCGPVDPEGLAQGVAELESWGLVVHLGEHLLDCAVTDENMFAASDDDRIADLVWALTDPAISAAFMARGGYGLTRIIDRLDWRAIAAATPRVVAGFSDVTALHEALRCRVNRPTLHSPHVGGLFASTDATSREHLRAYLFGSADFSSVCADAIVLRTGSVRAPIVGGNVAMLATLAGTSDGQPPREPFIALLEDIGEWPYRVDRMLVQLKRSGWFAHCVGVLGGTWRDCGASSEIESILREQLADVPGPMICHASIGHTLHNFAIPLGVPMQFNVEPTGASIDLA